MGSLDTVQKSAGERAMSRIAAAESQNRRRHVRVRLQPMYSWVEVKPQHGGEYTGHAYDISESGVRIELDEPLSVGAKVELAIGLPGQSPANAGEPSIRAAADVVWVNDHDDDPGPRRMALAFEAFTTESDRHSLMRYISAGTQRIIE